MIEKSQVFRGGCIAGYSSSEFYLLRTTWCLFSISNFLSSINVSYKDYFSGGENATL